METILSDTPVRQGPAERRRHSEQAAPTEERRHPNWALRIALVLGLVLTVGWGFLLGVGLVRLNTSFLPVGTVVAALLAAFLGSLIVSVAFHRLMMPWHKLARLLVLVLAVAGGVPLGVVWQIGERSLDPVQLLNATGTLIWELEGSAAFLGLIGGTWTGWLRPVADPSGSFLHAVVARLVRFFQFIARIPGLVLETILQFFENVGHGFLWLPLLLVSLPGSVYRGMQERWAHWRAPAPTPEPPARTRRRRSRKPKRSKQGRASHAEGPRVIGVVEDRCPYCFDIVKRNDARGVHICEVCGTPHHADCWAITGKCQIPHLNT